MTAQWLNAQAASDYMSMRSDTFARKVREGVIPAPSRAIGERMPRWNRDELDAMMRPSSQSDINSTVEEIVASIKASKQKSGTRRQAHASGRHG